MELGEETQAVTGKRPIQWVLMGLFAVAYLPFFLWCIAALWVDGPESRLLAGIICLVFIGACTAIFMKVRPFRFTAPAAVLPTATVVIWWFSISPLNNRDWVPEVARLAHVEFQPGDRFTIKNVRNFEYRSTAEFEERWETREYSLDEVVAIDLFICTWGPTQIAHTIASWEFSDGRHLAVSIETRKEKGETYSALLGFFRQFELYYVVADERDVIGLRAADRGEQVRLYRINHSPEDARSLLEDYLREIDRLDEQAEWYNAITHNCTTSIRHHAQAVGLANPWSWKLLLNGHLDEIGYDLGMIETSIPLEQLRRECNITDKAKAAIDEDDFSRSIRDGVPGFP